MNGTVAEIVGVLTAIVVLAGFSVAIVNGKLTAGILSAAGDTFVKSIQAATLSGDK
ncbi:MAG: hypothetical protein ACYDAK_13060 [Candidatus Limnocylindrales bacterium]